MEQTHSEHTEIVLPTSKELRAKFDSLKHFVTQNTKSIFYSLLTLLVLLTVYLRTRNIPGLKDITTGDWTLGPDLDPFLFLRWSMYIVSHGSIMAVDTLRNVPLGFETKAEVLLLPYLIAWFHGILSIFSDVSVTYAAIILPVVLFALTTIIFFFFTKTLFDHEKPLIKYSIALIATAFFAVIPALLSRTIAGIPEKESIGFLFIFLSFYWILKSFRDTSFKKSLLFGSLAGISTGLLALSWGGATFVFVTIAAATFIAFILGKIEAKETYAYGLWILFFVMLMIPFSSRYTFETLTHSFTTGTSLAVLLILLIHQAQKKLPAIKALNPFPRPLYSLILSGVLILLATILFFGPSFVPQQIRLVVDSVIHPLDVSRFGLTVAENQQPTFVSDWKGSFGPVFYNIPLYFWLFFSGAILLFVTLVSKLSKKERALLVGSYILFLTSLIFSRYSDSSILDGDSFISLLFYFGGFLCFAIACVYVYYLRAKEKTLDIFKEIPITYILYFIIFTMTIVGARGAVRLIMILAAVTPVAVAYLIVTRVVAFTQAHEETRKLFAGAIMIVVLLAGILSFWSFTSTSLAVSSQMVPSVYNQQWQYAMEWVRENTPTTSVFAHWWDYGYWVQSIGERATVLDGGNAIVYWNHLLGRYVLTGTDVSRALTFLYAHNATHLLIDSTDIGKYPAFSSIGSDENYDRFSWISPFLLDTRQTIETKNQTTLVYTGSSTNDHDIVWNISGIETLIPRRQSGVGGLLITKDTLGEPILAEVVFQTREGAIKIPLKYVFYNGTLLTFTNGLDAGVYLFPSLETSGASGAQYIPDGAALYLSPRTINSLLVRLYLFEEKNPNISLAHTQSDIVVSSLRNQGVPTPEIIYYQGFRGPIKIWNINYPANIQKNESDLITTFPDVRLHQAQAGEYGR